MVNAKAAAIAAERTAAIALTMTMAYAKTMAAPDAAEPTSILA